MPLAKEMVEMVNDLASAGYVIENTNNGHHRITNPVTGASQVLGGGNARGVGNAQRRLARTGFMQSDGRTPVPLPQKRTEGETPAERAARILQAARECTGKDLPDDWQKVGAAHASRSCYCYRAPRPAEAEAEAEAPRETTNGNGYGPHPDPTPSDLDEAILLTLEKEAKGADQIHAELIDLFLGSNWAKTVRLIDTKARLLRLAMDGKIHRIGSFRPTTEEKAEPPRYKAGPHTGQGLGPTQRSVLEYLATHGEIRNSSGRATGVLHDGLGHHAHMRNLAAVLLSLGQFGFIDREVNGKRTFSIKITPGGRRALEAIRADDGHYDNDDEDEVVEPTPVPTVPVKMARASDYGLDPATWDLALDGHTTIVAKMPLADFARLTELLALDR